MAQDPFPSNALDENRAGRLSAEQVRNLHLDARESKRSGVMAGFALLGVGLFILWGTLAGRIPGPRFQSLAVGAAFAVIGGVLLGSRGMTRGPRAAEMASKSMQLDIVEGPFRREREDRQFGQDLLGGNGHSLRGSARYNYFLYVGERRLSVGEPAYDAAPEDGIVRAYLLPGSDRIVNLERIGDAPPTAIELRASAVLRERFDTVSADELALASKSRPPDAAAWRTALLGRWVMRELPLSLEFRADGSVVSGEAEGAETRRWELLDAGRIRIDGEEQRIELDGDELFLATGGPVMRFRRARS